MTCDLDISDTRTGETRNKNTEQIYERNGVGILASLSTGGTHSMQMMGDQEPEETLTSPVITICSNFICPCPRRHCWSTRSLNGNSYSVSVNLCETGGYKLTPLLASRSEMCRLIRLETS